MNLFFLDIDPKKCAIYHCDKHVVKMLLEIVQMLYTAHHILKTINLPNDCYKKHSPQHPTVIWVRINQYNYMYAAKLGLFLAEEYTFRYNRVHSCEKHIIWLNENLPNFKLENLPIFKKPVTCKKFEELGMTPIPLAMPDESKRNDPIKSYRNYYMVHKFYFAKWTKRNIPWWFNYHSYLKYNKIMVQILQKNTT